MNDSKLSLNEINELLGLNSPQPHHQCVVRLLSSKYFDKRGNVHVHKELRYLKSLSNMSIRDMIPDYECIDDILNLHEVPDGLYELIGTNYSKDWETGMIDDWDYKLIPYVKEKK